MKSISVIVNGDENSVLANRAHGLFSAHKDKFSVKFFFRRRNRAAALLHFILRIATCKASLVYLVDTSLPGAFAVILCRLVLRNRFAVDTGDLAYELAKSTGRVGKIGLMLVRFAESWSLRLADFVVVRGTYHQEILRSKLKVPVFLIRDATWTDRTQASDTGQLRQRIGLSGKFVVGVVGTVKYAPKIGICYGWDLVESFQFLSDDFDAVGVVIGDGDGIEFLKQRAAELGVKEKIIFLGRVPYDVLHDYIRVIDVALSTQTNNLVGAVRTTGKLVEYMACERFVLASDVGEARLLLPEIMRIKYDGIKDHGYPKKLADRLTYLYNHKEIIKNGGLENGKKARELLDYSVASEKLGDCLAWFFLYDQNRDV